MNRSESEVRIRKVAEKLADERVRAGDFKKDSAEYRTFCDYLVRREMDRLSKEPTSEVPINEGAADEFGYIVRVITGRDPWLKERMERRILSCKTQNERLRIILSLEKVQKGIANDFKLLAGTGYSMNWESIKQFISRFAVATAITGNPITGALGPFFLRPGSIWRRAAVERLSAAQAEISYLIAMAKTPIVGDTQAIANATPVLSEIPRGSY